MRIINRLGNFLKPETKNILQKYQRLCFLTSQMGVPDKQTNDLLWLLENLPKEYSKHKYYTEAFNLANKLIKINKK